MNSTASQEVSVSERVIILAAMIPAAMSFTVLTPILQRLQADLMSGSHETLQIRIALSIIGLSMMLGAPLAGWAVDRIGIKIVFIASFAVWIGFGTANFAVQDVQWLTALRFLQGFGASGCVIAAASLAGRLTDESARGRLLGLSVTLATVGGLLSLGAAGVLGDLNWRYAFLLHLVLLPALIFCFYLPPIEATPAATVAAAGAPLRTLLNLFPVGLVLLSFTAGLITYSTTTYMPFRFQQFGVVSSSLIGFAFTAQTASVALSAALYGTSRRWLSSRGAFAASFALAGLGAAVLGSLANYWVVVAGFVIFGAGVGGLVPNLLSLASSTQAEFRGRIVGIVKGVHYGAALAGAVIFEPILRLGGPTLVMLSTGALGVLIAAGLLLRAPRLVDRP